MQLPSLPLKPLKSLQRLYDAWLLHKTDVDNFLAGCEPVCLHLWLPKTFKGLSGSVNTFSISYLFDLMKPGAGNANWWWRDLRRTICMNRTFNSTSHALTTNYTILGLLTTVVLFLRFRSTSLWKTRELSLKWQIHRSCHMLHAHSDTFVTCQWTS